MSAGELTEVFQPVHFPDRHGEFEERHIGAVVHVLQQLVDLLLHPHNSALHCEVKAGVSAICKVA